MWLLFTSEDAKRLAVHILHENGFVLPECGDGFSILKSNLGEVDRVLSKEGFDLNTRYIQML